MLLKISLRFSKTGNLFLKRNYCSRNLMKLKERGMYQDMFPDIPANNIIDLLNASPQCVYAGFDPTSDSLHVGNLLVLLNLLHWQRGSHQAIAVIGGATAKIGDPSGRSSERDVITSNKINENILGVHENISRIFKNHQKYFCNEKTNELKPIRIVNNENWYKKMSAIDLIGGAGRYMRLGPMLSRTSVETRMASEAGISYTEFSYQLFQSYDWLYLFEKYQCRFQIGGSDQMGNIVSGHDLISKKHKQQVYGLTLPLITTETGDKFGKSAGNAVWLSADKTSYFTFYQFWMRTVDSEVEKLLNLFTFDSVGAIKDLMRQHREKPELRLPQKRLTEQVMLLVHGETALQRAQDASSVLYQGNLSALGLMSTHEVEQIFEGASIVEILPEAGQSILDISMKAKCFPTISDAVRIIKAGGFYINLKRAINPNEIFNPTVHRLPNGITLVRVGKRNYYILKWSM